MHYEFGSTLCISTQAGCRMGCAFCASGQCGLVRNLTPGELAGQLYAVGQVKKFTNVVLMGCGEPLDNYDNVVKFLKVVTSSEGLNFSARSISISTCGLADKIKALAEVGLPVTLCISLHAADDEKRKKIMPIARKYSIIEVIDAAKRYDKKTGRRIVFEYILIDGFNDTVSDALQLAKVTGGMRRHINLIPVNKGAGGFKPPSEKKIREFEAVLRKERVSVTVRRTLGADIEGACGQLRSAYLNNKED
jgi:23S rRNA (adenine2503-C2)-methyltransferase